MQASSCERLLKKRLYKVSCCNPFSNIHLSIYVHTYIYIYMYKYKSFMYQLFISSIIKSSIDRTEVGGGFFDQLLARDKSVVELEGAVRKNINQELALDYLLSRGKDLKGEELTALNDLIRVFNSRKGLLDAVRNDIKMLAVLQVWLYIHVPTTFALISALLAHIFSVFVYWQP